jgi:fatty acid desaturase
MKAVDCIQPGDIVSGNEFCADKLRHQDTRDVRDSMLALPELIQPFLTWLTAKPASNEAYKNSSSGFETISAFLSVIVGACASIFLLNCSGYLLFLLPLSLIVTTSGFRKLQVVIFHNCVHGTLMSSQLGNYILGEFISILLLIKNYKNYKNEHLAHHSSKKLLTYQDDTIQFLFNFVGLRPGMKKNQLWKTLCLSLISPFCHLRGIFNRMSACLFSHATVHNIVAISCWSLLISIMYTAGLLKMFAIVWLLPLFILYQISVTLRLIVEHKWPDEKTMNVRGKEFICLSTSAIFLGEAAPEVQDSFLKNISAWSWWIFKMVFVHLFSRVFVLVGDTPCHDLHHRRPSLKRWYNYISERQLDEKQGCPGYPVNYSETWGLFTAINDNFKRLSEMKQS